MIDTVWLEPFHTLTLQNMYRGRDPKVVLESVLCMGEVLLPLAPWCAMSVDPPATFVYFTSGAGVILWQV